MPSRTLLLLAVLAAPAVAFTAMPSVSRATTRLSMIPDADFQRKLKTDSQLKDADRVVINECDDMECATVECVQDSRGNWKCDGGLEGEDRKTTKTILMTSADDGE